MQLTGSLQARPWNTFIGLHEAAQGARISEEIFPPSLPLFGRNFIVLVFSLSILCLLLPPSASLSWFNPRYSSIIIFVPGFLFLPRTDCSCGSTHSLSLRLRIFLPALRRLLCQVFPLVSYFNTPSCAQQGLLHEISFHPSILAFLGVTVYPILTAGLSCTQFS